MYKLCIYILKSKRHKTWPEPTDLAPLIEATTQALTPACQTTGAPTLDAH